MKKTIKLFAILCVVCALLSVCVFAADFEHCADALYEIGLFRGTDKGYELDRAPTRAEAAAMLVRLLGAEEEALALSYTAPYTDVADWAKPYVQYLHDAGLTKGTSETTFGSSDKCIAQQYATFLLRSLGYSDSENVDFAYADALAFAEKKGVCDGVNCLGEEFLRDNVVAMSYTALSCPTKGGDADLLSKLVSEGAIADAKGLDAFFADYRAYAAATKKLNTAGKISADIKVETKITNNAETQEIKNNVKYAAELNADDAEKSIMSYEGTITSGGKTTETKQYYNDGYMYINTAGEKVKKEASYFDAVKAIGAAVVKDPICLIRSIEKKEESGKTIYNVSLRRELMNKASLLSGAVNYSEDMKVSATCADGKTLSFSGELSLAGDGNTSIKYEYSNIKTGDEVSVNLPTDLSTYK